MWKIVLTVFLATGTSDRLDAEIVSEALLLFPAQTESLEYADLASLRSVPSYATLRERFSGTVVQQARLALSKLDIQEEQINEMVIGSMPGTFFGLMAGTFNGSVAARIAVRKGISTSMVSHDAIICPGAGICLLFLDDSLVAFGTSSRLKTLLEARQGIITRLNSNRSLVALMNKTEAGAPVRGIAYGSQIGAILANAFQDVSVKDIDWTQYSSTVRAFGYSVNLDNKAHITASIECLTSTAAAALGQMLVVFARTQSLAAQSSNDIAVTPFQNVKISWSDRTIDLKMDTPLPSS